MCHKLYIRKTENEIRRLGIADGNEGVVAGLLALPVEGFVSGLSVSRKGARFVQWEEFTA